MELKEINVDDILANFFQPRTKFDREKIQELAESILSNGLINPITVTPDKKRKGKYMIVSGERRWQAHKIADIKKIFAFIKEYKNDVQFMIESLIENIQREDLSSMETAKFIKRIWEAMGKPSWKDLGEKLGIDDNSIREHLSLVGEDTPKLVKKAVEQGKLAMRSASIISQLSEEKQEEIASEALASKDPIGRSVIEEKVRQERKKEIIKEVKKARPFTIIEMKKVLRTCRSSMVDVSKKQNSFVLFLQKLEEKGMLQELEWKELETILSAAIDSTEEYLKFIKKVYSKI